MSDIYPTSSYKQTLARFGLNVKTERKYKNGFSLYFTIADGKMLCQVTKTVKTDKLPLERFEVQNKEHLDQLLKVKSIDEIPRLTEVAS